MLKEMNANQLSCQVNNSSPADVKTRTLAALADEITDLAQISTNVSDEAISAQIIEYLNLRY
ncbi:MAG: hypothetical protein A3H44_09650 [Gammaproteobacteria bacterium RIFCSPLOWO2_02_FULL_57_10]|nr:MAG: hypothetical protein A3H44_09650 [Gammaproteobacteria bacterium RIFCSPLOWO2_02_FULL_57_10]